MNKINIVTIDPSIISTAMNVNGKHFNYIKESIAFNKSGLSKWYKMCENIITYRYTNFSKSDNYSSGEITNLIDYNKIVDNIITDIKNEINTEYPTIIGLEGFSYSSKFGFLIDLVTFSTLLRNRLFSEISENIVVFSPSTLKLLACKMTYEPIQNGKKVEYRNNEGVAGGKFNKIDIYKSIIENEAYNCEWVKLLREYKDELLSMKNLKKPFDDVNDEYNIYNIIKSKIEDYITNNQKLNIDKVVKELQRL